MYDKPITRRSALRLLGTSGGMALAGCTGSSGDGTPTRTAEATPTETEGEVTAAWIYVGPVGDLGWSWAHDQGRIKVEESFDWLETTFSESVPEADFGQVAREYSNQEVDILFGTSFGYNQKMLEVSKEFPDIAYEHCTGFNDGENMGLYYGRNYEAQYLVGFASGMLTEVDKIGYVAAFPVASVIEGMNGFAAGVKHANPDASVVARWTNTWFDPGKEKEAAISLIDEGVDVLNQHQDSPAAIRAANDNDIWGIGFNAPMGEFGGENYLNSVIWNWEEFYGNRVQEVKDGTWNPEFWYKGMNSGVVGLDEWGPNVPSDVKSTVDEKEQAIVDGSLDIWEGTKFEGKDSKFFYFDVDSLLKNYEGGMP